MKLHEALAQSEYSVATIVDQNLYRVTVAQESRRIRVSEGKDGDFARLQNDISTMAQVEEFYPTFYDSDAWEPVGEAEA